MVIAALASCTGMVVVSLLRRMEIDFEASHLEIEAKRRERHPKVFNEIKLYFYFECVDEPEKVAKVVSMSQEKYCSVGALLRKTAALSYTLIINSKIIE